VGIGTEGRTHGFQLSQRADFFEVEVGLETTLKRPIINTRDEPHADAHTAFLVTARRLAEGAVAPLRGTRDHVGELFETTLTVQKLVVNDKAGERILESCWSTPSSVSPRRT
jgi:hypothetical protein